MRPNIQYNTNSFTRRLYFLMNSDPSLNAWVNGGIHYEILPINEGPNQKKNIVSYTANKSRVNTCMHGDVLSTIYTLNVNIYSHHTNDIEAINDKFVEHILSYNDEYIHNINFMGDFHDYDAERDIFINTLTFECEYIK